MSGISIRRATVDDVPALLPQLERFGQFFGTARSLFPDRETAEQIVTELVASQPFWIAEATTVWGEPCEVLEGTRDDGRAVVRVNGYAASNECWANQVQRTPVGLIAGHLGPYLYNPALTVFTEMFWWVDPDHRGSRAGLLLLDAFEAFADAHADHVAFTLEHESPVSDRCLTKRGYRVKEHIYLREVTR